MAITPEQETARPGSGPKTWRRALLIGTGRVTHRSARRHSLALLTLAVLVLAVVLVPLVARLDQQTEAGGDQVVVITTLPKAPRSRWARAEGRSCRAYSAAITGCRAMWSAARTRSSSARW